MKINANFSKRAVAESTILPWVPSLMAGVQRRMLWRDGDEVARVTSLVRYTPGSSFSARAHTGGEEFLVLDGTFSDDYSDFPASTYVGSPVGSSHAPNTKDGCTILVKLWWMHEGDRDFVRLDTVEEASWLSTEFTDVEAMALHAYMRETSALYWLDRHRIGRPRLARRRGPQER